MISTITLDTYKQQIGSGDAFNLSDSFNGRVGDEQVPLVVQFKERGSAQQFQDGLVPFLTGFVGSLDENNQVTAETGEAVSYVGTSDDIVGLGRVKMNLPGTMFPQEGYFYGFLGLQNADGKRVTTFNVWFHVYNGNPDMFVNKAPFRTELQNLLDSAQQAVNATNSQYKAEFEDEFDKIASLSSDASNHLTEMISQLDVLQAKIKSSDIATNTQLEQAMQNISTSLYNEINKRPTNQMVIDMLERGFTNFDGGQPHAIDDEATLNKNYPNGHDGLFVTVDTGHMWMWGPDGKWIDGGVYQSTQIKDGSITASKLASNATFGFIYPGSTPLRYNTETKTLSFPPDTNVGFQGGSKYVNVNSTANDIELTIGDRGWIYVDTLTGEPGFSQEPVQNQNVVVIGGKLSELNIYINGPYLIDNAQPLSRYAVQYSVPIYESGKLPDYDSVNKTIHITNEFAILNGLTPIQIVNEAGLKEFDFEVGTQTGFLIIDRETGVLQKQLSAWNVSPRYSAIGGIRTGGKINLNGLFTVDGTFFEDLNASPATNIYFGDITNALTWNTDQKKIQLHSAHVNLGRSDNYIADQTISYEVDGTYYLYFNKSQNLIEMVKAPINVANSRVQIGWIKTNNRMIHLNTDQRFIKIIPETQSNYDLSANNNLTFVGDSITYGLHASDSSHSYPSIISKNANITVYNEGVSNSTWQNGSANDTISLVSRSKSIDFTRGNTVVLFAGTNDFAQSLPIGALTDTTDKTMLGAINLVIQNIYGKNSAADIRLILPMWRARINDTNTPVDIENTANGIGKYLKDYNDAIMSVGEYYHFPVLDLYHVFGINKLNYANWLADGLHPNDAGYAKLANIIGNFIARL